MKKNGKLLLGLGIGGAAIAAAYLLSKNSSSDNIASGEMGGTYGYDEGLIMEGAGAADPQIKTNNTNDLAAQLNAILSSIPGNQTTTQNTDLNSIVAAAKSAKQANNGNTNNLPNIAAIADSNNSFTVNAPESQSVITALGDVGYYDKGSVYVLNDNGEIDGSKSAILGISSTEQINKVYGTDYSNLTVIPINSNNPSDEKADSTSKSVSTATNAGTSKVAQENYYLNNFGITKEDYDKLYSQSTQTQSQFEDSLRNYKIYNESSNSLYQLFSQAPQQASYNQAYNSAKKYQTESYDTAKADTTYKEGESYHPYQAELNASSKNKYVYTGSMTSGSNTTTSGSNTTTSSINSSSGFHAGISSGSNTTTSNTTKSNTSSTQNGFTFIGNAVGNATKSLANIFGGK